MHKLFGVSDIIIVLILIGVLICIIITTPRTVEEHIEAVVLPHKACLDWDDVDLKPMAKLEFFIREENCYE